MSMSDLVAAGAPELPEGYFYRVSLHGMGILRVSIRRQRRIGSRLVADSLAVPRLYADPGHAVIRACQDAAEDMRDRQLHRAREAAAREFLGDHDPRGGR